MNNISEVLDGVRTMGIAGHIRPDGDCVGSCMALYLYIKTWFPEIDVRVYLDSPKPVFDHIDRMDEILTAAGKEQTFDLFVTCDVSAKDRIALVGEYFDNAGKTVCIDHHVSNPGFADINHIRGDVSSCCEVLYGILEPDKVNKEVATAVYTGIIHDTGVFQYSSTSPETMRIAGELMKTGVEFNRIIDHSFYEKNLHSESGNGKSSCRKHCSYERRLYCGVSQKKRYGFLRCGRQGSGWNRQSASPDQGR